MNLSSLNSTKWGVFIIMILAGGLIFLRYEELFLQFGEPTVIDSQRDGLKTYTNTVWHARHGKNARDFEGMNYPYKEHIVAATELPGLAILLQWLNPYFPRLLDNIYGITHLLLMLCLWLCPIILYLIFKELSLPNWYAIIVAIGITFLAPQNLRLSAHYGLAPLFVITAILHGLLLLEKRPSYKASIYLISTIFIASLLHFYFFAICILSIGLYFMFTFFRNFNIKWFRQMLPYYAAAILVPTSFFVKWVIIDDPISDRSPQPWGFLVYRSKLEGIFTFKELPFWKWINDQIIEIEKVEFEGWAYIGLVATLFLVGSTVAWGVARFKKPVLRGVSDTDRQYFYPLLGMGIVLAIFACSQPFATKGLEFLLDYAGPLRQFRSTGRFAWVFYFVINIIAFTGIYKIINQFSNNILKHTILWLALTLLSYEAYTFSGNKYMFQALKHIPELDPGSRFTDIPGIDYKRYQAILPIPYFNVGSNNFGVGATGNTVQLSCILSMQTGLPMTGAMLTRSSRQQSFNQLQLVGQAYHHPNILSQYPNKKPLLLLLNADISEKDSLRYLHLFNGLTPIHKTPRWALYELELTSFDQRIKARKSSILEAAKTKKLYDAPGFQSTDSLTNYVYEDFNQLNSNKKYRGNGAHEAPANSTKPFFVGKIPLARANQNYDIRFWVFANEDRYNVAVIKLEEVDSAGKKRQEAFWSVGSALVDFDSSGWVLVNCPFVLKSNESSIQCSIQLNDEKKKLIYVDELLIKPQQTDLFQFNGNSVWMNNEQFD